MGMLAQLSNNNPKRQDFAIPELRKYPVGSEAQARTSLAKAEKFGTTAEKNRVKIAVRRRYPNIGVN